MIMQTLTDPLSILSRLLFQPVPVDDSGDEVVLAIERAAGRWPVLQPALEGAAEQIRVNVVNPDAVLRGSRIWSKSG